MQVRTSAGPLPLSKYFYISKTYLSAKKRLSLYHTNWLYYCFLGVATKFKVVMPHVSKPQAPAYLQIKFSSSHQRLNQPLPPYPYHPTPIPFFTHTFCSYNDQAALTFSFRNFLLISPLFLEITPPAHTYLLIAQPPPTMYCTSAVLLSLASPNAAAGPSSSCNLIWILDWADLIPM